MLLLKSPKEANKHYEYSHTLITYNSSRLHKMMDPEIASQIVLLAERGSSNRNTVEVPFAATKTIKNIGMQLQKQLGRPYPVSTHASNASFPSWFQPLAGRIDTLLSFHRLINQLTRVRTLPSTPPRKENILRYTKRDY